MAINHETALSLQDVQCSPEFPHLPGAPVPFISSRNPDIPLHLVIETSIYADDEVVHIKDAYGEIVYDVPHAQGGVINTILYTPNLEGAQVPLAVGGVQLVDGIPLVTMLQRVKAFRKFSVEQAANENSFLRPKVIYRPTEHPSHALLQGEAKIEWEFALLDSIERVARANSYPSIRVQSGFSNKYLEHSYPLSMAIQQYDILMSKLPGWVPAMQDGGRLESATDRTEILRILKKARHISSREGFYAQFSEADVPIYWEKRLGQEV